MSRDVSFADYIVEDVLGHLGEITRKVLFSGYGIYMKGKIVGIIIDGVFYTKASKELMEKYKSEGDEPFQYERPDGKVVTMPYVSVSIDTLEDREKIEERMWEAYDLNS